jgi:membrane protein YqaA with SNARE-associated domain
MQTATMSEHAAAGSMATPAAPGAFDRFVNSRTALAAAFAWGLAEATFFFIVPDVLLTLLACRAWRPAWRASLAALSGALLGGLLMFAGGALAPAVASEWLLRVPAISPELVAQVQAQLEQNGLRALFLGPLQGVPYKIYAVVAGTQGLSWWAFVLVSLPTRYLRFLLAVLAARGLSGLLQRWTQRRVEFELTILLALWLEFYCFYFTKFGW